MRKLKPHCLAFLATLCSCSVRTIHLQPCPSNGAAPKPAFSSEEAGGGRQNVIPTAPVLVLAGPPQWVKPESMCMRLFSSSNSPMKTARYRWRVGKRSGQGETRTGWVIVPPGPDEDDVSVTLEWGPLVESTSLTDIVYPYEKEVRFPHNSENMEDRAAKKLSALNCEGDLSEQLRFYMSERHLIGPAFCDGRISPDLWNRVNAEFDSMIRDPDEPLECRNDP